MLTPRSVLIFSIGILVSVCNFPTNSAADSPGAVPPAAISKCYEQPVLNDRYKRFAMSMDGLISLIQKVERHPTVRMWDANRLTSTLLKRFRYDGIVDAEGHTAFTSPIKKNLVETDKFSLIWSLIPGQITDFPEDALDENEKCALHFMLSYSVNGTMRTEERFPRQLPNTRSIKNDTIERKPQLDEGGILTPEENLADKEEEEEVAVLVYLTPEPFDDVFANDDGTPEKDDDDDIDISRKRRETSYGIPISKSPLQSGVIHTPSGTVAAGVLLAGIAAGLEPQTIRLKDWMQGSSNYNWSSSTLDRYVSNIWASTIASDMAQSGLLRIHLSHTTVGPSGKWNDTVALCPKEYTLETEDPSYLTTAEIFGGIDGLLLGLKLKTWDKDYFKLSSLLKSYYSEEGVPQDRSYRGCNRINNFLDPNKVDHALLKEQALTFLVAYYDKDSPGNPVFTLATDRLAKAEELISQIHIDLKRHLDNAEDMREQFTPCQGIATLPTPAAPMTDSDVTFVIDQFVSIEADIEKQKELAGWLGLHLNVGANGSQLEIVSSYDGSQLVMKNYTNKAQLACDIKNTKITVQNQRKLHDVLSRLRKNMETERSGENANKISGTNAKVVLFSITGRAPSTQDMELFKKEYDLLKEVHPDVRIFFALGGTSSSEAYKQFVQDEKDIFKVNFFRDAKEAAAEIAKRTRNISARLVYPECAAPANENLFSHSIFVTPGTQKYFKIMPATMGLSTSLKLTFTAMYGSAEVCLSRNQDPPNSASALSVCKTVPEGPIEFANYPSPCLSGGCTPIFVSVKAQDMQDGTSCADVGCESAEQVKIVWSHEGMRCSKDAYRSGASAVGVSQAFLILVATFAVYMW